MGCCCGASAIDPNEALSTVREEAPEILIDGEDFKFAFAFTRDQVYFTSHRVLVKDKQGFTGSSVAWRTVPYTAIKAFYVKTAGSLDMDMEIGFWPSGLSQGDFARDSMMPSQRIEISFKKDGGVDIFALQRLLNEKIFQVDCATVEVAPQPEGMADGGGLNNLVDLLGGDARAIDPKMVETQLRADPPILLPDEVVDMAFKCGRDTTCFTSRRLLRIDVQGLTGKKVMYLSYLWSHIKAFAVETPGAFLDRDCEIKIWNGISHIAENVIGMDLRNSSTDIMAIQRYLSDRVLGQDTEPPSAEAGAGEGQGQEDSGGGWRAWLCGDMRQLDAAETNRKFHEEVQLLQGCETCEMAFKGARDMVLFTTKRMVLIDPQGITGKKIEYKSIPWGCVQAFGLQSPGAFLDKDSEMLIWTDIYYSYHTEEEEYASGDETQTRTIYIPDPGQSHFSVDFQKDKVDLEAVGRYLATRCAKLGSQSSVPPTETPAELLGTDHGEASGIEKFIGRLGDDYRQCDPDELDEQLHGDCSMLLPDEKVQMGFVCGRDTVILTSHRAMKIDKQGFTGKKVLYLSLPWTKIKAYEVESAGTWDLDAEMRLTIKSPWYNKWHGCGLDIDFSKGRCDVIALNRYISAQIIGAADGTSAVPREILPDQPEGMVGEFLSWLGDDYKSIPREEATEKFKNSPAILLDDETVDISYKCGRDFVLFTTKRYIKIDTQGLTGNKVSYKSLPYKSMSCYEVSGAASHPFDRDAEVYLHSDAGKVSIDVKKDQGDIMATYTLMNKKCIIDKRGPSVKSE